MKNVLIIYHGTHCNDGFTAAWVAATCLKAEGSYTEPDLYPMGYGEQAAEDLLDFMRAQALGGTTYTNIYILDFSLQLDVLAELVPLVPGAQIVILDHHKSAFNMYFPDDQRSPRENKLTSLHSGQVFIRLINHKSGAGIAWDYFFPHEAVPPLVRYVQDRDLWLFKEEGTKQVHKYLASLPKTLETWGDVHAKLCHATGLEEIVSKGQAMLDIYTAEVEKLAAYAEPCSIKGERGLMAQCSGEYASDVGNILATTCGTFGMTYYETEDEENLKVSLRSEGDYDVEVIAKRYGGGGHRNAAGFIISLEDMMSKFTYIKDLDLANTGEQYEV